MNTNTSSLMRRVAKHLDRDPDNARPRADEPGRQAGLALIEAGLVLYFDTDPALARARDFGGRGYAGGSTAEGRGKGGHSSPTEAAAFTADGFAVEGDELRAVLVEARGTAVDAVKRTKRLLSTAPPVTEKEGALCLSGPFGCGDLAVKDGYCQRCYDYRRRHPDEHHVPESEFSARRQRDRLAS